MDKFTSYYTPMNVLDLHILLRKPYPDLMNETEQLLWERNGKPGNAVQYKAETVRFAISLANKYLKEERARLKREDSMIHPTEDDVKEEDDHAQLLDSTPASV